MLAKALKGNTQCFVEQQHAPLNKTIKQGYIHVHQTIVHNEKVGTKEARHVLVHHGANADIKKQLKSRCGSQGLREKESKSLIVNDHELMITSRRTCQKKKHLCRGLFYFGK